MATLSFLKSSKTYLKLSKTIPLQTQTRNTFVLKRRNNVMLSRINSLRPKELKSKHFVYDLVTDLNTKKRDNIDLLLTSYVEGLGERGDFVSVKPHYGRQNLLLPGLAVYVTPENLEEYSKDIEARKRKEKTTYSSQFASLIIKILSQKCIPVIVSSGETWTIEPWHIRVALRLSNLVAPEYTIELPTTPISGPDLEKEDKEFAVYISINKTEKVPVRCRIHHLGIERSTLWEHEEREAILPEQKELLSQMPRPNLPTKSPA